jgi:hypothetical protein
MQEVIDIFNLRRDVVFRPAICPSIEGSLKRGK